MAGRRAHAWDGLFRLVRSIASDILPALLLSEAAFPQVLQEAPECHLNYCNSKVECSVEAGSSNFGFGAALLPPSFVHRAAYTDGATGCLQAIRSIAVPASSSSPQASSRLPSASSEYMQHAMPHQAREHSELAA